MHTYLVGRKKNPWAKEWELEPLIEGIQVDADTLVPKLSPAFLGKQPVDWLIKFIQYAIDGAQSLKRVPFIRLSSGGHVCLTNFTEKPLAWFAPKDTDKLDLSTFPLVHNELAANKQIREFLKKENISEINSAAIVIECILPKYQGADTPFVESEYREHLRQIHKAYSEITENKAGTAQFTMQLRKFAWLACVHASGNAPDKIVWKKPGAADVFMKTAEHEKWFHGLCNVEAYFLHSSASEKLREFASRSGVGQVADLTLLSLIQNLHPNEWEKVTIHGRGIKHKQGLNGFKPDATVIGLQAALDSWNTERAGILWNIMLSAPRIVSGKTQSEPNQKRLDAAEKKTEYTEVGRLCRDHAWLLGKDGEWHKPSELFLTDLRTARRFQYIVCFCQGSSQETGDENSCIPRNHRCLGIQR